MRAHPIWPVALLFVCSCAAEHYQLNALSSLRPVDATRPMVVFNQLKGEACGRDAVLGAIRDIKRLDGVDGFVEVIIETRGRGDERCAKVTAFPFRYGTSTAAPRLVPSYVEPSALLIPGAGSASEETRCPQACERAARTLEPDSIKRGFIQDRCLTHCANEPSLLQCLAAATRQSAVQACLNVEGGP